VPAWRKKFRALDGVSFEIREGEVFGLVGESGSGKSTVANVIAGLVRPTKGRVRFAGAEITGRRSDRALRPVRRQMQMVFQDPYSSLNSRLRVCEIVGEPLVFHGLVRSRRQAQAEVDGLLLDVGLDPGAGERFPHAFSGGQRQRISIARALATSPRFLICDEPTSSLDVSVQAQILNLLKDLKEEHGLTMLLISHDLPVIRQMCDRVAVMRHGRICEIAETARLFAEPQHAYTRRLLSLMPRLDFLSGSAEADAVAV
jgi:peptide/nickel transport system ATP-binding protein